MEYFNRSCDTADEKIIRYGGNINDVRGDGLNGIEGKGNKFKM